jgi:hypothetical protein
MPGGVDHDHDDQPEHEADADGAERTVVLRVGDDRAAAGEPERERRDPFGGGAAGERKGLVHSPADAIH